MYAHSEIVKLNIVKVSIRLILHIGFTHLVHPSLFRVYGSKIINGSKIIKKFALFDSYLYAQQNVDTAFYNFVTVNCENWVRLFMIMVFMLFVKVIVCSILWNVFGGSI